MKYAIDFQRLIDHISGATWFDITKFALKIKSSIFVLVNWKKKKKFNPTWPFLRCSQRKTDFFFELDNPLLSLLQTPEQPQLCSNSRALNGPWQIYSLATDPQRREDWGTLFVLLWDEKGKTFYGRLKREKTREKERHDSLIHHVSEAEINLKKSLDSHNQPFFLMEKFAWVRLSQRPPESRLGPLLQFVFINLI